MIRISLVAAAIASSLVSVSPALAQKVEVTNNQPFAIRMPWRLRDGGQTVLVDVPATGKQTIDLSAAPAAGGDLSAEVTAAGAHLTRGGRDLGTISWDVVVEPLDKKLTDKDAAGNTRDFAALFKPLAFKTLRPVSPASSASPLFHTLALQAEKAGLKLHIELDVYPAGFVDVRATATNESAPRKNVYAAVVARWQQPAGAAEHSVDYDNHVAPLADGGSTPFRRGEGRHLFVQRGVDWIRTTLGDAATVAWLNDFTPSFTVHHDKTAKQPPRWVGANTAQLAQEATLKDDAVYSITEIARPSIRSYASRLDDNVLPGPDQPLTITSRLIVGDDKLTDERANQLFVAYTGYNAESKAGDTTALSFGVPNVKFGTAYFPYSTLGENFEAWHMPGQSQNTYWPLSADTVTHWKLFADDIRRDLRIAKAMGFESIRLHHLEMIAPLPKDVQDEYLDFFFGELKHLGLTALLDVKLPPERVAELVKRYRPQIDGVEVDNEVLIFGINDEDVPTWKATYAAVKAVAPDLPVHWTAHTNTGACERLRKLDVPFDRVGQHAYADSLDAIPSLRDFALAVADYASKVGKPPVITEWNWRFLTRMTPENRAKVYPPIFENVLKTRCMPEIYQFQFQESLAMASRTLRGIRHYELLNLSRRPRPEAMEFEKLIARYGDPAAPQNAIRTEHEATDMHPGMHGEVHLAVRMTNTSAKTRKVAVTAEGPAGVQVAVRGQTEFDLEPNKTSAAELVAMIPDDAPPGFYHVFARIDAGDAGAAGVSYGWQEIRKPGAPKIDKDHGVHPEVAHYGDDPLGFDFNRPLTVVYGTDASGWEVESAWLLYQTLESAIGRPVDIFQLDELPPDVRMHGNLIVVGTPRTNRMVEEARQVIEPKDKAWVATPRANRTTGDEFIVAGDDDASVNLAAIDTVLRYWKYAKDAGMRRVPLTDKPIEKGADPNALP